MPSFAQTSILATTVAPKDPVLSLSKAQTMLATPLPNSTAMTGRAVHLKFVKIVSLVLLEAVSVVAVAMEVALAAAEVLAAGEALLAVEDTVEVSEEGAAMVAVVTAVLLRSTPLPPLHLQILSPTSQVPVEREVRQFTCAMYVRPQQHRLQDLLIHIVTMVDQQ